MANKRAFSLSVVDSDAFLSLPVSSRLLYFDIAMRSDDDGFCNSPKKIMRITGATEDDLKVLVAKKFIIPFESGVVVIKHWRLHNAIRKDMYKETNYRKEKALLTVDERGIYHSSVTIPLQDRNETVTNSLQECTEPVTQYNIIQSNINKDNICASRFDEFWDKYPRKTDKKKARAAWMRLDPDDELFNTIMSALDTQKKSEQWQTPKLVPHPTTWLNGERWNDILPFPKTGYLQRETVHNPRFGTEYLEATTNGVYNGDTVLYK